MAILLVIVGLLLFIGLVVAHEFGHFLVARRNGVDIEEFGIGFPPKLWGRRAKGGFLFTINLLPLGGFVRLKGEHDADTGEGTFGAASLGVKTKIMLAGVMVNLVLAFVLLMGLAWIGMPQLIDNQFTVQSDTHVVRDEVLAGGIESNSPAAEAGLKSNDQIVSIQGPRAQAEVITSASQLSKTTKRLAGETVQLTYKHNGDAVTKTVTLHSDAAIAAAAKQHHAEGYLGVAPAELALQRSTWSAPIVAAGIIKQFTVLTFKGLGVALKGLGSIIAGAVTHNHAARETGQTQASDQVSGPVGIFIILKDGSALGYQFMLMIIAVISLTLAIMNILPIPALDGGKVFVTLIARLFHRRVSEHVENWVYGASFVLLFVLIGVITLVDIKRFL